MYKRQEIDTACRKRLEIIEKAMMQQEGVTEALKAADQMAWVRSMKDVYKRQVLCTGSRFHHYIAPGQEFFFVKGAIQYPAVLCKSVQNQAVNALSLIHI